MPESITREGSAPLSEKGRRAKRPNRRKRAKQWTFLIEKLKLAVDGLYEMCREEQNLNGCKEALMYLQNSSRDFESLIASIHVELSWEEKEKPSAVAWEIRKSMSSPAPAAVIKDTATSIINQMTPLMFSEVVKAASDRKKHAATVTPTVSPQQQPQLSPDEKRQDAEEAGAAVDDASKDEWQVVLRGRRKKSLSSMTSDSRDDLDQIEHTDAARPSNVYERLTSSTRRHPATAGRGLISASTPSQSSNYMSPKSAMDLPQTKASMAKMAYSRQLLWQRSQSTLMEKMKARQVRSRNADFNSSGGGHRATLRGNGEGERRATGAAGTGGGKAKSQSDGASDTSKRNLTSIRETQEDEKGEIIPLDPKPSMGEKEKESKESPSSAPPPTIRVHHHHQQQQNQNPNPNPHHQRQQQERHRRERLELQEQPQSEGGRSASRSIDEDCLSFPLSNPELLILETDREWREMTEEEESLAFEERSLNIEIEQEKSLSIDAELERQVAAEADALEREEEEQRARDEEEEREREEAEAAAAAEEEEEVEVKEEEEEPKMTAEEMVVYFKQLHDELVADLSNVSWSEMVERDLAHMNLREPGEAALRHERMMSPSRKRGELSEEDLSRRHEQKQRRADELREKLKEEKAARLKALLQKVEEVREKRLAIIERKRVLMENRLRTANANRERNLEEIVRKAREDEMKVMEAQLIHELEKGNMRMDQQKKEQRNESRRQEMKEERAKKQEEKAEKVIAAEERRKMNDTRSDCSALSSAAIEEEQRVETPDRIEETEEVPKVAELQKEVKDEEVDDKKEEKENQAEVKVEEEEVKKEEKEQEKKEAKPVEKKEKKRKTSKEKERERKKERREEAEREEEKMKKEKDEEMEMEEYEWREVIANWSTGDAMLADERSFRCGKCGVELRSEWDAVAHAVTGGHEEDEKGEEKKEEGKKEEGKDGEEERKDGETSGEARESSRKERVISLLSAHVRAGKKKEAPEERKEMVSKSNNNNKKRKAAAQRARGGGETARQKEAVETLARAVGGGHGPSVDLWRDVLTATGASSILGEEQMREVTIFSKRAASRKKAPEAVTAFVEEYGRSEGAGGDTVLATVLDSVLRALTSDRSIRGPAGKTREEKETREIEEAAWSLLRCLSRERKEAFERLFSPSSSSLSSSSARFLRAATALLARVDAFAAERNALKRITVPGIGRAGTAALSTQMTTLQPGVFELLQRMAEMGAEAKSLLALLDAPRRLATLPIAHLIQPPNRHILLSALVAITREHEEALHALKQHLSPWHIVQFLKSEIDRVKCICPLHTVLPTRESIDDAIQYYEKAIL